MPKEWKGLTDWKARYDLAGIILYSEPNNNNKLKNFNMVIIISYFSWQFQELVPNSVFVV
jgi:hypothetical protein